MHMLVSDIILPISRHLFVDKKGNDELYDEFYVQFLVKSQIMANHTYAKDSWW